MKSLLNTGTSIGSSLLTLYITSVLPKLKKINVFLFLFLLLNYTIRYTYLLNMINNPYRTANSKIEYNFGFSNDVKSVELTGNFNFNHSIMSLLGSMING